MLKKSLISLLFLLCLGIASAATVTLDSQGLLANNSYQTSASVYPNFKVSGNSSTWTCHLYTNENSTNGVGSWTQVQTMSSVANETNTSLSTRNNVLEISGTRYCWDVFCNSTNDVAGDWGGGSNTTDCIAGFNYSVDITSPSITVNAPSSASGWDSDGLILINITTVDNNAAQCRLLTTMNGTSNLTQSYVSSETKTYSNNTWFNFSRFDGVLVKMADNNTGAYYFSVSCNDSAAQSTSTSNYTIWVDTTAPGVFDFNTSLFKTNNRVLTNASTATDYTPQIGWSYNSTELNFSRYHVCYFNDSYSDANPDCVNITTATTLNTSSVTLIGDEDYLVLITAYDLAGNAKNMTTLNYKYSTDSTNRALSAGWNIVGNVGNAFNLSDLLSWTGATTVSYWNASHQFETHVSGGSYGGTSVGAGYAAFVYMGSAVNFSDMIWNTTAVAVDSVGANSNITNKSSSDWNLVVELDDDDTKTVGDIDKYLNCNPVQIGGCSLGANNASYYDYFSVYNNTASTGSKYVSFVSNWTTVSSSSGKNMSNTVIGFGDTVWIFQDDTVNATANYIVALNWSNI